MSGLIPLAAPLAAGLIGALLVAAVAIGLHRAFPRAYLRLWAMSWVAAFVALIAGVWLSTAGLSPGNAGLAVVFALANGLHGAWLLRGTRVLTGVDPGIGRAQLLVGAALLATISGSAAAVLAPRVALLVQYSLPLSVAGSCSLWSALLIWKARPTSVGLRLIEISLALWGLSRINYVVLFGVVYVSGRFPGYGTYMGFAHFPILVVLALGIAVALLEEEHHAVLLREERLRASEERYQLAAQATRDVIWDWSPTTNRAVWSPALAAVFGHAAQEALPGSWWEERVHPEERGRVVRSFQSLLDGDDPYLTEEYRFQRADGSYAHVLDRAIVVRDAAGKALRMIGAMRDLSERKQAERLFQAVLESAPDAMLICDGEGKIVIANARVEALFGWSREELIGQDLERLVPDRYGEAHRRHRGAFLAHPRARPMGPELELYGLRKDGTEFNVEVSLSPLSTEGRSLVIAAVRDVTDRKEAERTLSARAEELARSNAELERFSYTVSHDLKSPLVTIRGYLALLERSVRRGEMERFRADLARMAGAADRMGQLLEDLLELSRVGRVVHPPEDVSLAELTAEARDLTQGRLAGRAVQVQIADDLPVVRGDRRRLLEVLQNLIDNAAKFMGQQPRPRIEVGVRSAGARPVFFVRDNGIGIEAQHREKVFGLFDKLDARSEGTGVGLALVRRIVEAHRGRIWVESNGDGVGSSFCFTLGEKEGA